MPVGSVIVRVALSEGIPCLWAVVPIYPDPNMGHLIATRPTMFHEREFIHISTGGIITGNVLYIGTYVIPNQEVYHIFELLNT
jgi:hypothetical protein